MKHMTYNRRLAEATLSLFENGAEFITPDQIFRELNGYKCPNKKLRTDIESRLGRIKAMLNREYDQTLFLLTKVPDFLPPDEEAARKLVPGIGPNKAAVIGKVNGPETQMIYLAEKEQTLKSGSGMVRANTGDLIHAVEAERIPLRKAATVASIGQKVKPRRLSSTGQKMLPSK